MSDDDPEKMNLGDAAKVVRRLRVGQAVKLAGLLGSVVLAIGGAGMAVGRYLEHLEVKGKEPQASAAGITIVNSITQTQGEFGVVPPVQPAAAPALPPATIVQTVFVPVAVPSTQSGECGSLGERCCARRTCLQKDTLCSEANQCIASASQNSQPVQLNAGPPSMAPVAPPTAQPTPAVATEPPQPAARSWQSRLVGHWKNLELDGEVLEDCTVQESGTKTCRETMGGRRYVTHGTWTVSEDGRQIFEQTEAFGGYSESNLTWEIDSFGDDEIRYHCTLPIGRTVADRRLVRLR